MAGSETGSSDEVEQQQDQMLPPLLLEVPIQRESLLGRQRLYQAWGGRNIFCCGGRLVTGPEPLHLVASVLLLLPLIPEDKQLPCTLWVFSLLGICLVMLFVVAFTDPGVIPRGTGTPSERAKECIVNGHTITLRWCHVCNVFRPPRAKHCFTCDNCVASFDHHCPWISNCVGLRNRRSFFVFISLCSLLCIVLAIATALAVLEEIERANLTLGFSSLWQILTTRKLLGMESTICVVAGLPLFNLVGFNCYLIAKNVTTAEEFHQPYGTANPFSQGWKRNCYNFWLSSPPPRAVDFRSFTNSSSSVAIEPPDPSNWRWHRVSETAPVIEPEAASHMPTPDL